MATRLTLLMIVVVFLLITVVITTLYGLNSVDTTRQSLRRVDSYQQQLELLRIRNQELETQAFNASTKFEHQVYRWNTRYWLESRSVWPKAPIDPADKYITFSPWRGGFNNIRMSLEMAVAAAFAFNRTLVMPPEYKMYLRGASSLESYFDYDDLSRGISVITYKEFLERVPEFARRQKEVPEDSDTLHSTVERYYSGLTGMDGVLIHDESVWGKGVIAGSVVYCVPECPPKPDPTVHDHKSLVKHTRDWFEHFQTNRKLTYNTKDLDKYRIIHFPQCLLGHFYNMFWFQDPQLGKRLKRIVRDHVHFKEGIINYAERIINRLGDFKFSCIHVRRNEFQFKDVWTPAEEIVENVKDLFNPGEHIYISTDELSKGEEHKSFDPTAMAKMENHEWFTPMIKKWGAEKVHFLDEYFETLLGEEVPKIWIGCIESVICTRARVFVGTRKSTFSGYIQRMRGYMVDVGQKMILDAQARYPEDYYYYFKGPTWSRFPHKAYSGGHPYWGREYNEAWEGVYNPIS